MRNRGSWLLVAALLAVCGLGALAFHAWRERGEWSGVKPGAHHSCVEMEGEVTDLELSLFQLELALNAIEGSGPYPPPRPAPVPVWNCIRSEVSTRWRSGYAQFLAICPTGSQPLSPEDAFVRFTDKLHSRRGVRYRFALVDEKGDVVRLESPPPPP